MEGDIERLARELATRVNEAPSADREELRAYAVGIVREEVQGGDVVEAEAEGEVSPAGFNPLGMGIPVLLVGTFLIFLFPPVGVLLMAAAGFLVIWGLVATLFSGRKARPR